MKKLTVNFIISLLIVLMFGGPVFAWGPLTHMSLALEAYQTSGLNYDEKQMAAFLAGTVEPDIGVEPGGDMYEHSMIYQDPDFIKAMVNVAERKKSPEKEIMLARARGYAMHILTDSVAHKADSAELTGIGYPNSKKVFENGSSHGVVELCVDFLTYRQKKYSVPIDSVKLDFMSAETIVEIRNEFAAIKNIELNSDPGVIKKQALKLQATVELEKVLTRSLSDERISQMNTFFNDRYSGVANNQLALETSKNLAIEKINNPYEMFTNNSLTTVDNNHLYGGSLFTAAYNTCIGKISDVLSFVSGIDPLVNKFQQIANSFLFKKNDETKKIATFIKNILADQCVSFEECIYLAEKECGGHTDFEKEKKILSDKLEAAKLEYQNRPWWRIDYLITNADYKKYIKLENEYNALTKKDVSKNVLETKQCLSEILPVEPLNEVLKVSAGDSENQELAVAYQKLSSAYKKYVQNGFKESDYNLFIEANEDYKKLKNIK